MSQLCTLSKTLNQDSRCDEHYPLKFGSKNGAPMVYISQVTAGYGGTGPFCAKKSIEKMGFVLSEEEEERIYSQPSKKNRGD